MNEAKRPLLPVVSKIPSPEIGPDDESSGNEEKAFLAEYLEVLTAQQKKVILARFFEYKTLEEISSAIGVCRERVRQIESQGLAKIRACFDELH